jgi:hypothetical protein
VCSFGGDVWRPFYAANSVTRNVFKKISKCSRNNTILILFSGKNIAKTYDVMKNEEFLKRFKNLFLFS